MRTLHDDDRPDLDEIFAGALERPSEAERAAWLDGACRGDAGLRARVEVLLAAHAAAGDFLEVPEVSPAPVGPDGLAEGPGTVIGPYKLLQEIGEGGFGAVYMAEQTTPVRRKVALKIIKLGMDTKQVIARFEAERQALALLDHPNIARVLDAGATEAGRPYFVMELVRGISIAEYCDRHELSTRERLELFVPVCRAVQHAHMKGIIHRDLKPSNVLVTLHDGVPVPKIIDFGIAKATSQRLTEKTLFTEFRQFIGTPEYMSPEQAEMSGLDVDTRTDVYSLGVILYELLTGTTPIDREAMRAAGWGGLQRLIREQEPPKPSTRVSTMGAEQDLVARRRRAEPRALSRLFRGDLDWIVMRAMEKDRTRRYETASDLAADVRRHLDGQPVEAGPPSVVYKLAKLVRRNRLQVGAAALVAAALVTGLALATFGLQEARSERDAAQEARERADREAARATRIADLVQDTLVSLDPARSAGADLEELLPEARAAFGDDHGSVAELLAARALQLQHAGDHDAAQPLLEEALALWQEQRGPDDTSTRIARGKLGVLLEGKGDSLAAERELRAALERPEGAEPAPVLALNEARTTLADVLSRRGEYAEAEALLRDVLEVATALAPNQHFAIAAALEKLVQVQIYAGRREAADATWREMLATFERLRPGSNVCAALLAQYGTWLYMDGRSADAEPVFREALDVLREIEDPPRQIRLMALNGLFQILRGDPEHQEEADTVRLETIEAMGEVFGPSSVRVTKELELFAADLAERGLLDRAVELLRRTVDPSVGAEATERLDHTLRVLEFVLGRVGLETAAPAELYERGLELLERTEPVAAEAADAPVRRGRRAVLRGMLLYRLGRIEAALAALPGAGEEPDRPYGAAIEAMILHRSGEPDAARRALAELRAWVRTEDHALDETAQILLAEAERVLSGGADD